MIMTAIDLASRKRQLSPCIPSEQDLASKRVKMDDPDYTEKMYTMFLAPSIELFDEVCICSS